MYFRENLKLLQPYLGTNLFNILNKLSDEELAWYAKDTDFNDVFNKVGLYTPSVSEFCQKQFDDFCQNPVTIEFDKDIELSAYHDADFASTIAANLLEMARCRGWVPDGEPAFNKRGYFVSFGLGIGTHIHLALQQFDCQNILIIEPELDFLIANLVQRDWGTIVKALREKHGHLDFLISDNPNLLSSSLISIVNSQDFALIEGSLFYSHYQSDILNEVKREFEKSKHQIIAYNGWLEDEYQHLQNHLENTLDKDFFILHNEGVARKRQLAKGQSCFVVGSGPSLDQSLVAMKEQSDNMTVFSCGTALRPLLAAGIVPDFHVELENSKIVYDIIKNLSESYDLSNIHLICPTNSTPGLEKFFKARLGFIRETGGFLKAFSYGHEQVQNTAPSPVNTALKFADILGFSYCFLFGTDFSFLEDKHHAENSIYYNANEFQDYNLNAGSGASETHITVPGNLTPQVKSNGLWTFMRNALEFSIQISQLQVINCSNGAKIANSVPLAPEKLLRIDFPKKEADFNEQLVTLFMAAHETKTNQSTSLKKLHQICKKTVQGFQNDLARLRKMPLDGITEELIYQNLKTYFFSDFPSHKPSVEVSFKSAFGMSMIKIYHIMRYIALRNNNTAESWRFSLDVVSDLLPYLNYQSQGYLNRILSEFDVCSKPSEQYFYYGSPPVKKEELQKVDELIAANKKEEAFQYLDDLGQKALKLPYPIVFKKTGLLQRHKTDQDIRNYISSFPYTFPNHIHPYRAAIAVLKSQGNLQLGIFAIKQAIPLFPMQLGLNALHSNIHTCCRKYSEAIAIADETIRVLPDEPHGYAAKAEALYASGKKEKALLLLQKMETLPVFDRYLLFDKLRIDLATSQGNLEKAKTICKDSIEYYASRGDPYDVYYFKIRSPLLDEEYEEVIGLYMEFQKDQIKLFEIDQAYAFALTKISKK